MGRGSGRLWGRGTICVLERKQSKVFQAEEKTSSPGLDEGKAVRVDLVDFKWL